MDADQPGEPVRIELDHRSHVDHPSWDIPEVPGDLFPLRAVAMFAHDLRHRPICAVVQALRPGETARVHSDHPIGPLCHALDHRCSDLVGWVLEQDGPSEWTVLLTRQAPS